MVVLYWAATFAGGVVGAVGLLPLPPQADADPTTAAITRHFIVASKTVVRLEALEGRR
jgi:hypothetical protein